MFTGIIEEVGIVKSIKKGAKSSVLTIQGKVIFDDLHLGDSIAVNGVCLTVTDYSKNMFSADVMHETLNRSSLGGLKNASRVNLERAMSANGRLGGHIVSGHIDGTGQITKVEKDDNAIWYTITTNKTVMRYIVEKGSIAIDGISLTVAKSSIDNFSVSMIPHTAKTTTLLEKSITDVVNLENDVVGKYIEKLLLYEKDSKTEYNIPQIGSNIKIKMNRTKVESKITKDFLTKSGY